VQHAISVSQFTDKTLLSNLFTRAEELQNMSNLDYPKPLTGLTIATIFYEPSTRTRLSFETAIQNLGGQLITTENAGEFSSAIKGESLEDTIQVVNQFAQGIVIRHPEIGAAKRAAAVSEAHIINAGDGAGEHPTQALLDMYSVSRAKGSADGLKVALVGDLLNGRTVHSLIPLLSQYKVEMYLVAPASLRMPQSYLDQLDAAKIPYQVLDTWDDVIPELDVLYMTRVQKERFVSEADYLAVKDDFILTNDLVQRMKPDAMILHPLPRVNEIEVAVDADPRAQYFQQVKNGLYLRMALLEYLYS
jgi:aspartate carbamoyltransferase catalytic subunit